MVEQSRFTLEGVTSNKILVRLDAMDRLKTLNTEEIIEIISKLCFGKRWFIVKDLLLRVKQGIRAKEIKELWKQYNISESQFGYIRWKLMNMGLIERIHGKYYLSDRFSQYMSTIADAWDFVRRT
jgi:hypothetical protein